MKDYLRWSLRQLYLLYFQPSQFESEVEGRGQGELILAQKERLGYINRMLLWIVLASVFANLAIGFTCEKFGVVYLWNASWLGVILGIISGVVGGVVGRVGGGVIFGMVFGMAFGVEHGASNAAVSGAALGVAHGLFLSLLRSEEGGLAVGIATGAVSGVTLGPALAAKVGLDNVLARVASAVAASLGRALMFGAICRTAGGGWHNPTFGMWYGLLLGVLFSIADSVMLGVAFGVMFWAAYFRFFSYPFDIAFSFVAYLYGRRRPQDIRRAWRLCPVVWNEVIWLDMPFATRLLTMLTMQDRREGFRQIAFVAAERRLQRRVAVRATEEIVINDLRVQSLKELSNVPLKLEWTTDAPAELPEVLVNAFPRFERAAQHAGQYLMLHSDHRRGEALRHALAELDGLQKSLVVAVGRLAPRLLRTANQWRSLLEDEQKTFTAKAAATLEIPNPFAFGNALGETKDNTFVGRQDIVRKIESCILGTRQTPTLLMQGARRMGKSSILNQLPRMLGPNFAPVVIDCQEAAIRESSGTMLRYLSRAIGKGLQRRRIKVNLLTKKSRMLEPYSNFKDWLENAERDLPEGLRILLCFDEYEHLQDTLDAGWGQSFLDTLRHWIQHHPKLVLMFTGAHAFEELGPAWTDRFISARRMRVSFLERDDLHLLLTKPIPEFDLVYSDGALEDIVRATNGQPFLTQAVAFELVQYLNEQHRKDVTTEDVEEAIARALVSGSAYFANVWMDAGEQGRAVLKAIAGGDTPPDYPHASAWLRENDVLDEAGEFAVPMVRRWVRETGIHKTPYG